MLCLQMNEERVSIIKEKSAGDGLIVQTIAGGKR